MKKRKKILIFFLAAVVLVPALFAFCRYQNYGLMTTHYSWQSASLPEGFDGFVIAQISDLHNTLFGENNEKLVARVAESSPDIIVLTGDLVDRDRTDIDIAMNFINQAMLIAPCYFVTGNHEYLSGQYDELHARLIEAGVEVMDERSMLLERGGDSIYLLGLSAPEFFGGTDTIEDRLSALTSQCPGFRLLLAHKPESIEAYVAGGADFIISGHAHGGQVRLPFIGGLGAPGQGLFPKYTCGLYELGDACEVVSRGLGNSNIPLRVFNRPEVVIITMHKE